MSKVTKYYCDRCGLDMSISDRVIIDITSLGNEEYNYVYDLCPFCATSLVNEFIKGGKDETNNMLNS